MVEIKKPKLSKKIVLWVVIATLMSTLVATVFYFRSVEVTVVNDTKSTVIISDCYDTVDIQPSQQISFGAWTHQSHLACVIRGENTGIYLGCLAIPTPGAYSDVTFRVSSVRKDIQENNCGV